MHQGRLRLRPWLEEQIRSGKYPGVTWIDETAGIFQIPWKHAARHGWNIDKDATLFRNWAMHTGRYKPGIDKPDPKTWKANFRCALNSLPDVKELHDRSIKKGNNAFRVYMMLPSMKSAKRRRGQRESVTDFKYMAGGFFSYPDTIPAGALTPLEHFPDACCRYRDDESGYVQEEMSHPGGHATPTTPEKAQDYYLMQSPYSSDPSGNPHSSPGNNEHAQAVMKIVEHLKNTEHWTQSHDSSRSWGGFYCEGMDHSTPQQTSYHIYSGQHKPFFS